MFPDPVHPWLPHSATPIKLSREISGSLDGVDMAPKNMHLVPRRERKVIIWHDLFYQSISRNKKCSQCQILGNQIYNLNIAIMFCKFHF